LHCSGAFKKGHSLGGEDLDDQVLVPLTTARKRILGFWAGHPTAVGGLTLRVADGADMGRTSDVVRDLLRERHRLGADSPDDFVLRDLRDLTHLRCHPIAAKSSG
jgi:putative ABC transport system permease protein